MSDHPTLPERELDDRIRQLVGRAIADAPPPPLLATQPVAANADRRGRRPWYIVGTSLLGAAAATIAVVIAIGRGEGTLGPAGSPPDPTATAVPAIADPLPRVAIADGNSVTITDADGAPIAEIAEPWSIALAVGDGRVVGQTRSGPGYGRWETAATTPYIWSPDGTVARLFPTVGERSITLHDIGIVDSVPWLLYSVHNGNQTPDGQREDLHAVSLDGRAQVRAVGQIGAWESGTHRLHLAANGLIVGERSAEGYTSLVVLALPDSPAAAWAATVTPATLGLDEHYLDCADTCPRAYTVDDTGTRLAWLEGTGMVIVALDAGIPGTRGGTAVATPTAAVVDLDLIAGDGSRFLTSYLQDAEAPGHPSQLVLTDGTVRSLNGLTATWGPAGADAQPTTAPALPAPAAGDPLTVFTAGPNGIARVTPPTPTQPQEMFSLDPAAIAFDLGDDGVLAQPASGYREGASAAETAPILIGPDGAGATWSVAATDTDQTSSWQLHDVVRFQDAWWVVYSRQSEGRVVGELSGRDIHETLDRLFAVPLAGGVPTDLGEIGGWEWGTSRVQANPDGVLVASRSISVTTEWWTASLPGATASTPTPTELGIEATTSECGTCPRLFGWTSDGRAVTWLEDTTVVIHPLDGGDERRIDLGDTITTTGVGVVSLDVGISPDGSDVVAISIIGPDEATSAIAVVIDGDRTVSPLQIDQSTATITIS
ncbi:MAG: hypothetical protein ACK5OX_16760 [Desertimonas sp.]